MSDKCKTIKAQETAHTELVDALFKTDIEHAFDTYFQKPDKKTNPTMYKYWLKTKELLVDYSYSYGLNTFKGRIHKIGNFTLEDRKDNIKTYEEKVIDNVSEYKNTLGWRIVSSFFDYLTRSRSIPDPYIFAVSKHAYRGVYSNIKDIINKKQKSFKPNVFVRNFMPKGETVFWQENGELVSDFIRRGEEIDDAAVKNYLRKEKNISSIYENLKYNLTDKISKGDLNSLIVGEVKGFYINKKNPNNEIQILKIYQKRGKIVGLDVRYVNGENKNVFNVNIKDLITHEDDDVESYLQDELIKKSVNTFIDDILLGQTQYWIPSDNVENIEQLDEIGRNIEFDNFKRKTMKQREEKMKSLGLPIKELTGASPYIKMKKGYVDGKPVEIFYTIIKQTEAQVGEKYNVFIVKHKFEGEETVDYYFKDKDGWRRNKKAKGKRLNFSDIKGEVVGIRGNRPNLFNENYYMAKSQKQYGPIINKKGKEIKGSSLKGFDDFKKLSENLVPDKETKEIIDETVYKLRQQDGELFEDLSERIEKIAIQYKHNYAKISEFLNGNLSELQKRKNEISSSRSGSYMETFFPSSLRSKIQKEVETVNNFLKNIGIETVGRVDYFGNIIFPFEKITKKGENYSQVSYAKEIRHEFILNAINESSLKKEMYENKLEEITDDFGGPINKKHNQNVTFLKNEITEIQNKIEDYQSYLEGTLYQEELDKDNSVKGSLVVKTGKHRLPTDETKRQKDYFHKINKIRMSYHEIERLDFISDLLSTTHDLLLAHDFTNKNNEGKFGYGLKENLLNNTLEDIVNFSKIALKDIDAESKFFGIRTDYKFAAKQLNKISKGNPWTPEKVKYISQQTRAFFTQQLLGTNTAITNLSQSFLPIGAYGKALHTQAVEILTGQRGKKLMELWEEICAYGGAGNVFKAFMDMLSSAGQRIDMDDGLSYKAGSLRIFNPKNTINYIKLFNSSREKWIKDLRDNHYSGLVSLGKKVTKKLEKQRKLAEKGFEQSKSIDEEEVYRRMINLIYDITHLPSNKNTKGTIIKMLNEANIDAADITMRKFVKWKLEWNFDDMVPYYKNLTTFSETEQWNHKITYVMALLAADKMGVLGYIDHSTQERVRDIRLQDPKLNRFKSDVAVEFGRKAIQIFQFMHNQAGTGEANWGLGSNIMQFKPFPINRQKLQRNARIWLRDTSENKMEYYKRIMAQRKSNLRKTFKLVMKKFGGKNIDKKFKIDQYGNEEIDYEARKLVYFRNVVGISALTSFLAYQTNILYPLFRRSNMNKYIRGFDSPVQTMMFGLMSNMILSAIFSAMGDDDKAEDKAVDGILGFLSSVGHLMIPLIPSYLLQNLYRIGRGGYDLLYDENSDWSF